MFLSSEGLHKSRADSNMYYLKAKGKPTLLLLYVDDVYVTAKGKPTLLLLYVDDVYVTGSNTLHITLIISEIDPRHF